jgi:hypothetical protein
MIPNDHYRGQYPVLWEVTMIPDDPEDLRRQADEKEASGSEEAQRLRDKADKQQAANDAKGAADTAAEEAKARQEEADNA